MVCFCKRDDEGRIISAGWTKRDTTIPENSEVMSPEEYVAWGKSLETPSDPQAEIPSTVEQLRADIDYLAALQGVTL